MYRPLSCRCLPYNWASFQTMVDFKMAARKLHWLSFSLPKTKQTSHARANHVARRAAARKQMTTVQSASQKFMKLRLAVQEQVVTMEPVTCHTASAASKQVTLQSSASWRRCAIARVQSTLAVKENLVSSVDIVSLEHAKNRAVFKY